MFGQGWARPPGVLQQPGAAAAGCGAAGCGAGGPEACCSSHATTGFEQSLDEVDFERSLCAAAGRGDLERVSQLIQGKHDVNGEGSGGVGGYTPLHYAARGGHAGVVRALLGAGADPGRRTSAGGATPLHRAAYSGHTDVVQLLIGAGADAGAADGDGETPLHKAAGGGHADALGRLVAACPAALAAKDRRGRTPSDCGPAGEP